MLNGKLWISFKFEFETTQRYAYFHFLWVLFINNCVSKMIIYDYHNSL